MDENYWKKKYERAREIARSYYGEGSNEFLDTIFPEFNPGGEKDEKVKKIIVDTIAREYKGCLSINGISEDDCLSWIERHSFVPEGNRPKEVIEGWVARDKDDYLGLYRSNKQIHRGKTAWVLDDPNTFLGTLPGTAIPELNFEDEAMRVKIIVIKG